MQNDLQMLTWFTPVTGLHSVPAWGGQSIPRTCASFVDPAWHLLSENSAGTAGIKATGVNQVSI